MIRTALLVMLALAIAPLACAQVPLDPAGQKVQDEAAAAQADPVAFASHQASAEGVGEDVAWAVEYACDLSDALAQESETPLPGQAERCDDLEDAVGVEEEAEPVEEDVAVAEPLEDEDEAVGEALELADDGEDAVAEILDDPLTAPEVVLGLALAAVAAVDRILDRLVDGLAAILDGILGDLGVLPAQAAALPADAAGVVGLAFQTGTDAAGDFSESLVDGSASASGSVADSVASTADAVGDAVGGAGSAVADAAGSTGAALGKAASSVGSGLRDFVASLFDSRASVGAPDPADEVADVDGRADADGLLEDMVGRVDGLTRAAP